jgi:glyceraldehyde 3-phosphate dehydrogenase
MLRVAINGLGRIGRAILKILEDTPSLELVAINDRVSVDNLVYLLRYDTVYGRFSKKVDTEGEHLLIENRKILTFGEEDPLRLPWRELQIDLVFECTGIFRRHEELARHLEAGARRVILSTPANSSQVATVVCGINEWDDKRQPVVSMASCTTHCVAPVVEIMARRIGVKKAVLTTLHACMAAMQRDVDLPNRRMEQGRAYATNLIPTFTDAATAIAELLPYYAGRFDGGAIWAPVSVGSIADMTFVTEHATTTDEVNQIFQEEARTERYVDVLSVAEDPVVSSDIIQNSHASVVDLTSTQVVDGDLVKVMSWYDSEWGYASQMVKHARRLAVNP